MIGVEQQKDVIVTQRLPTRIRFAEGIASQQHAETSCKVLVPFDDGHLSAGRREPCDVFPRCALRRASLQESTTPEHRVQTSKRQQSTRERQHLLAFVIQMPIDPAQLVVLAIGVVVAVLRAPHFIAGREHRHALRKQERRQQIAFLPRA